MERCKDLTGQRFGRLTVIDRAKNHVKPSGKKEAAWNCLCDCGGKSVVVGYRLTTGCTKSCGCLSAEKAAQRLKTHGKSKTRLHRIWVNMHRRCSYNKHEAYVNYGGRGIQVCNQWEDFAAFYNWAINNGYSEKLTLDRIDVNRGYGPNNCRWSTRKEQSNNKRNNILINYHGKKQPLKRWAEDLNLPYSTLFARIRTYKWPIIRAFETPVNQKS